MKGIFTTLSSLALISAQAPKQATDFKVNIENNTFLQWYYTTKVLNTWIVTKCK